MEFASIAIADERADFRFWLWAAKPIKVVDVGWVGSHSDAARRLAVMCDNIS